MAKQTPRTTEPDVAAAIAAVVEAKRSFRAVAKDFGVSHVQVRRWVLAWRIAHPEGVEEAEPEVEAVEPSSGPNPWSGLTSQLTEKEGAPLLPEAVPDLSGDALQIMKENTAQDMARVKELRKIGSHELAQRAARDVAKSVEAIARLEAARPKAQGDITFTLEEYREAERQLEELIHKLLQDRPLLCADCGKKLSMKWGSGGNSGEPGE